MAWLDIIYPHRCSICNAAGDAELDLCANCLQSLPWQKNSCQYCALPLPEQCANRLCASCLHRPPVWDRAFTCLHYQGTAQWLIQYYKYRRGGYLGRSLGLILADCIANKDIQADVIIPVPLHPYRLLRRGYNQAYEIAKPVAKILAKPLLTHCVERVKYSPDLSGGAGRQSRRMIARRAFKVALNLVDKKVLVVDDVMTTGATVGAFAKAIKQAGASEINVAVLARTP